MQVRDTNRNRRGMLVVGLVCLACQLALAPNVGMGYGRMNFAVIYATIFALSVGGRRGVLCGFAAGLVYDLSTTGPVGLMALLLTVASLVLGTQERNRLVDGLASTLATFGVTSLAVILAYHLVMLAVGQASGLGDVLVMRTLPSFALTFLAFVPFACVACRSAQGETGNPVRRQGRGSHFDLRGLR